MECVDFQHLIIEKSLKNVLVKNVCLTIHMKAKPYWDAQNTTTYEECKLIDWRGEP